MQLLTADIWTGQISEHMMHSKVGLAVKGALVLILLLWWRMFDKFVNSSYCSSCINYLALDNGGYLS